MPALLQRWTRWAGGPVTLALLLAVQALLAVVFAFEPRIVMAVGVSIIAVVLVFERPVLGVGVLLAARLLSTGALVFMRIGKMGIGPFEPALALCLVALVYRAVTRGEQLWRTWPWQAPFLAFMGWVALAVLWSPDRGDGISVLFPLALVLLNTMVILVFVKTWEDFRLMLWFWVGACVLIGVLAVTTSALGISTTDVEFKAASGGGRETGLGQQPNWFAMNLMFIIHTCFGMALVEKRRVLRMLLVLSGFFVFVMMLKSGSRGGAYATLIGGVLAALAHPLFRKWFLRFGAATGVVFLIGIATNLGDTAKALNRIASNTGLGQNYRELNWLTCVQMFQDTWGLGIGSGGYDTLLPSYNMYVAESLYDYPHGIFWEVMAHWGIIGLVLIGWLAVAVVRMVRDIVRMSKGTEAEVFAWTFPASMMGYIAWSFVEFTITEKPFWEFLALYTALYLILKRVHDSGGTLPQWKSGLPRLLGRDDPDPALPGPAPAAAP